MPAKKTTKPKPLTLKIQLTVIDELGINLYSNTPAVLSELVANAWDADAKHVSVAIDITKKTIIIEDDGVGMDRAELQDKYLKVGYRKRGVDGSFDKTPLGRRFMGRKGIGKLSIFAIAGSAKIETVRYNSKGTETYRGGMLLEISKLRAVAAAGKDYSPNELKKHDITPLKKGTRVTLTGITKGLTNNTVKALRARLARRFSIIGPGNKFEVKVNKEAITPKDRDYFHKLEYVWWFGPQAKKIYSSDCKDLLAGNSFQEKEIKASFNSGNGNKTGTISGWIGTAREAGSLTDSHGEGLNRIVLMARGKLAQEDILPWIDDRRIGRSYLIGEIHADFIDDSDKDDMAVASRQSINENDSRQKSLINALSPVIKNVISQWDKLRKDTKTAELLDLPAIKTWYETLDKNEKTLATKMVRGISRAIDIEPEGKKALLKQTVVAFEHLRFEKRLNELDSLSDDRIERLVEVFSEVGRLEAAMYGEIAGGRIKAIDKLQSLVDAGEKEKLIQKLLAENLWLLDTAWERATAGDVVIEKSIRDAWKKGIDMDDLMAGRVDIAYRMVSGKDVIIELKRSTVTLSFSDLYTQVSKYIAAFKKAKKNTTGDSAPDCQVRVIVGRDLLGWTDRALELRERAMLLEMNVEVCFYNQLTSAARKSYSEYIEKQHKVSKVREILDDIERS